MLNAVKKGKVGEKEFCKYLEKHFDLSGLVTDPGYSGKLERNYNQAEGGADIIVKDFIFEIKRRETLDLDTWWHQVCVAKQRHLNKDLIQVVAFRKNKQAWEFLIPARLIGLALGYLRVNERVFLDFAKTIIKGAD